MEKGETDVFKYVEKLSKEGSLTPAKIRFLWEGMLEALKYLHDERVVHSDVKPANFLLVNGIIKIIDFGFAQKLAPGEKYKLQRHMAGTKDYLSPETLASYIIVDGAIDIEASKKRPVRLYLQSDIWALGIILHQWVYGVLPYATLPGGRVAKVQATISHQAVDLDPLQDLDLLDTLKMCLIKKPLKRPLTDKLLQHPYLRPSHKRFNRQIHDN